MASSGGWRTRGAAIVAAMILLASPARAGCSLSDIASGVKQSVGSLSDCAAACSDGVGCGAAVYMTSVLTGVATDVGQDAVNSFCSQAQGDAAQIVNALKTAGGSKIEQALLGEVADVLNGVNGVGTAGEVVQCACEAEKGGDSLGSDLGDCVEDALCALQSAIFGDSCDCTPPPPAIANCAATNSQCNSSQNTDPACRGAGPPTPIFSTNSKCQPSGTYTDQYGYTTMQVTTPAGTYVAEHPPSGDFCDQTLYCFCPAPMKPHCTLDPWASEENTLYIFSCDCPDHTHPGALRPEGISNCLCDNTNQPAILSGLAIKGMCPPPACPAGQTRLGSDPNSPCVTPCSDPSQGMAFDGSCCNPAQMTTCGKCCPPTTVPDPNSGTCVPRPQPPK